MIPDNKFNTYDPRVAFHYKENNPNPNLATGKNAPKALDKNITITASKVMYKTNEKPSVSTTAKDRPWRKNPETTTNIPPKDKPWHKKTENTTNTATREQDKPIENVTNIAPQPVKLNRQDLLIELKKLIGPKKLLEKEIGDLIAINKGNEIDLSNNVNELSAAKSKKEYARKDKLKQIEKNIEYGEKLIKEINEKIAKNEKIIQENTNILENLESKYNKLIGILFNLSLINDKTLNNENNKIKHELEEIEEKIGKHEIELDDKKIINENHAIETRDQKIQLLTPLQKTINRMERELKVLLAKKQIILEKKIGLESNFRSTLTIELSNIIIPPDITASIISPEIKLPEANLPKEQVLFRIAPILTVLDRSKKYDITETGKVLELKNNNGSSIGFTHMENRISVFKILCEFIFKNKTKMNNCNFISAIGATSTYGPDIKEPLLEYENAHISIFARLKMSRSEFGSYETGNLVIEDFFKGHSLHALLNAADYAPWFVNALDAYSENVDRSKVISILNNVIKHNISVENAVVNFKNQIVGTLTNLSNDQAINKYLSGVYSNKHKNKSIKAADINKSKDCLNGMLEALK